MKVKVLDMTCNHCVMKIQKALLIEGVKASVELSSHEVTFKKDEDLDKVKKAITEAGYTVTV
ncbi:MAG: cation transporter [Firmicutes bacterium]|nr:cation transporter [Bacillota bacterium]